MPKKTPTMPTDEEIWAEVDAKIETFEPAKHIVSLNREDLFKERKSFYQNAPKRLADEEQAEAEKKLKQQEKDSAYLESRRMQGKAIVTHNEFFTRFPAAASHLSEDLPQEQLQEQYEVYSLLDSAGQLFRKIKRFELLTEKLRLYYLSKAYGLYKSIELSDVSTETIETIRDILRTKFNKKTDSDSLRSRYLILLLFQGISDKTATNYSQVFFYAYHSAVEENEFEQFVVESGGMEKICRAFAQVRAADSGKLIAKHIKQAEEYASMMALQSANRKVVQLGKDEGARYVNDILGQFCLLLVHADPLDQIEIVGQVPSTPAINDYLLSKIGADAKKKNKDAWQQNKDFAVKENLKKFFETFEEREKKKAELDERRRKKSARLEVKNKAMEKRFEKERQKNQQEKT